MVQVMRASTHHMVLRPRAFRGVPRPLVMTDLPDVLLQLIMMFVAMPRRAPWGVALECLYDVCVSINYAMQSCTALRDAVAFGTWCQAIFLNVPRMEAAWNILQCHRNEVGRFKRRVKHSRRGRVHVVLGPAWAAPLSSIDPKVRCQPLPRSVQYRVR